MERLDYAKWRLDDPAVNLAISTQCKKTGLNHFGMQVDTAQELTAIAQRLEQSGLKYSSQQEAACCYARSDKHWIVDPQGIAWGFFRTLGMLPLFGEDDQAGVNSVSAACCIPLAHEQDLSHPQATIL